MLSVTAIASVTRNPERVIATNYYQPPHLIPLVEIVGGQKTDSSVIKRTVQVLGSLRKKPVVVPKEFPGLIVGNRIQIAIAKEIQALVDEGMATPQQVDDILMFGLSRRMSYAGFFRRLDMMGLDFLSGAYKAWGLPPWRAVDERVERGELGLKTGKGFYDWPENAAERFNHNLNTELVRFLKRDIEEGTI